jgi:anthranilate synthase/indole-3-glycerol phosphate synthase/phosphoribosylanthranilate isomerase
MVDLFGGEIAYAGEIMHGKTSKIRHDGRGIFKGLSQGIASTRYHSLSASVKTLPPELAVTAVSHEIGVIMGVRHRKYTIESVQYHPESIMSEEGDTLLKVFLGLKGGTWAENPHAGVTETDDPKLLDASKNSIIPGSKPKASTILEKIYAQRLKDVTAAKSTPGTTESNLSTLLSLHLSPPLIPLVRRLKVRRPALMAEIKRASPSKGNISLTTNTAQQAIAYALAGASVISVLTEPTWFKGSLFDMRLARQAVDSLPDRPAILRKDFILDEYQIAEARLHGADTVLLIVAMLPSDRLQALYAYSLSLGMEPLVEVNNAQEMERALELGAKVIGVNNRNLHDFEVDMGTTSRLASMVEQRDVILCALSGISTPEDVRSYVKQGVGAVLVGEALMRAPDPGVFIRHLLDVPEPAPRALEGNKPLVKICGIRSVEHAAVAADAGADLIGLVFAPHSKRVVELSIAREISQYIKGTSHNGISSRSLASVSTPPEPWFSLSAKRLQDSLGAAKRPMLVGVFQNQPLEHILRIVTMAQLDLVQLHGDEPLQWVSHIQVPVIRAFHLPAVAPTDGSSNENIVYAPIPDLTRPGLNEFVLLDAVRPGAVHSGGAGVAIDWNYARRIVEAGEIPGATPSSSLPIILAGGLTVENVQEAIQIVRPWAVDVSGGVETNQLKDPQKIRAFVDAVKGAVANTLV